MALDLDAWFILGLGLLSIYVVILDYQIGRLENKIYRLDRKLFNMIKEREVRI